MLVVRWSSSCMMPLRVGSKCWTMTKAMPLSLGTRDRKCSNASNPPADAPMPTMGNDTLAREVAAVSRAALAGFFRRRSGLDFVFMILLATPAQAGSSAALSVGCLDLSMGEVPDPPAPVHSEVVGVGARRLR